MGRSAVRRLIARGMAPKRQISKSLGFTEEYGRGLERSNLRTPNVGSKHKLVLYGEFITRRVRT